MADVPGPGTALGVSYHRHRPEETLLYQVVERYYPQFAALRSAQDRDLPSFCTARV